MTDLKTLFAVREAGTEKYFPAVAKDKRRGGSFTKPEAGAKMRVFYSRRAAAAFIGQWKLGEFHCRRWGDAEYVTVVPVQGRQEMSLEIVQFVLLEKTND